jgi:hypothetical protein
MRPPRRLAPDHAYVWRQLEQGLSARGLLKGHVVLADIVSHDVASDKPSRSRGRDGAPCGGSAP